MCKEKKVCPTRTAKATPGFFEFILEFLEALHI